MIEHCYLVVPVAVELKIDQSPYIQTPFCLYSPPHRRDYYVCTSCGTYSCGGIYSCTCTQCNGIISNPPRDIRDNYLCTKCACLRPTCTCDQPTLPPPPPPPPPPPVFRPPPKYCWCSCCTCCTYSCSCLYCKFFCECLSSPCKVYEPCCYCTRECCPEEDCCQKRLCFWSWCPFSSTRPPSYLRSNS